MLRRASLVVLLAFGLFVTATGTAQAWDLIAHKSGYGHVVLRAWTKNYNQVAFVVQHTGTRVHVAIVVDCNNGDHFDKTWSDGGSKFRFVLKGLGNSGRCDHTLKVDGSSASHLISLAIAATG